MKSIIYAAIFTIITTLFSVFTVNIAFGQGVQIGISAGANVSSHLKNFQFQEGDINLDFNPGTKMGLNGGLILRVPINKSLRFQAEPSIARIGAKYDDSFELRGFNFQSDSKTDLLYIQLPLLLQLSTTPPERTVYGRQRAETTYHLTGGFYGGYLLDATFSGTNSGAPIGIQFQGDFSEDVIDQYKTYDGGLILGGGLEHGAKSKIGLEVRAFFSITDSGNREVLRGL
ncbi:outer membrane beta-barrel protein [Rhodohalobacter sp.]|uniref:outer membrane beta-barrel protein n=1 Tax=Rhodohalobacter sp. TaxID=1974210 RepID=UPI002ACE6C08|nr:outer membrane beta-barrel protein [Rhodohalobacter sp.]MDZ7758402.1 outer membrane beta-barrel protein [Rhodohalobacter sp.]